MNYNCLERMNRKATLIVLLIFVFTISLQIPGLLVYGDQSEYVWVLRDIEDYDAKEKTRNQNKESEGVWHIETNYSRGRFTQKRTYTGKTTSYPPYSDAVHGESMTFRAEWGSPPGIMKLGEKYPINFFLGLVEDNSSKYTTTAWAVTELNGVKLENSYVKLNIKTDYKAINETLILEPSEGTVEGQKLELTLLVSSHVGMKTVYVYEWMKASEASKVEPPAPYTPEPTETEQKSAPTREIDYEV
ncbi:hypothetical protein KGY64_04655, partial [Candidatus Bipolaricaulota bacterium]|nr:hypothetical protein [Candidatus Bipolaricaulota bacterium]